MTMAGGVVSPTLPHTLMAPIAILFSISLEMMSFQSLNFRLLGKCLFGGKEWLKASLPYFPLKGTKNCLTGTPFLIQSRIVFLATAMGTSCTPFAPFAPRTGRSAVLVCGPGCSFVSVAREANIVARSSTGRPLCWE